MIFFENPIPPRIRLEAGFFGIMLSLRSRDDLHWKRAKAAFEPMYSFAC